MKQLGYGSGYKYAHDYEGHFAHQQYLPDDLKEAHFWYAQHSPSEEKLYQRIVQLWGDKKK